MSYCFDTILTSDLIVALTLGVETQMLLVYCCFTSTVNI